jgi:large subunit ribosomal protein L1
MAQNGKKYRSASERRELGKPYEASKAIDLVKQMSFAKFDETVEVAIRLGVDPRHADQVVRGTVVLPEGTGKTMRVLVIAAGAKAQEAQDAGADYVGTEYLAKIKDGWLDFDVLIATPDQMGQLGQLGRVLGPRGLMPNPKAGTVTFDVAKAVKESKGGKIEFRVDKHSNLHFPIGKASFSDTQLTENYGAVLDEIMRIKPSASKGRYVKKATMSTTMGPGIQVDPNRIKNYLVEDEA